jgi:CheY-like chemotaxis protein
VTSRDGQRGHLLVVDAEHYLGRRLRQSLSHDHDIEMENRGDEVVRRLDGGAHFDVILCDVMMPDCTGPELCAKLAVDHPIQAAGMVFMTDGVMSESARKSLATMSNLCIRRPFDADGMRALVWRRTALGRA